MEESILQTQRRYTLCTFMYLPFRDKVVVYHPNGDMRYFTRAEAQAQLTLSTTPGTTVYFERVLEAFPKKEL